jgi:hypothetical protein
MAIFYFLVFFTACVGVIALRKHSNLALTAYRILPAISLAPYLMHVWWAWDSVSGFGRSPDGPPVGVYPGLVAFALFAIGLVIGLVILAVVLARRFPLFIPLTPVVAGFFYWQVALRLLSWQAPDFIFIDNVPLVWLFLSSVFSVVLMGACGWVALILPVRSTRPY